MKGIKSVLILTRRIGESIIVGDDVVVKILDVKSGQVSLGVDAPKNVRVDREEVRKLVEEELSQRLASGSGRTTPTRA